MIAKRSSFQSSRTANDVPAINIGCGWTMEVKTGLFTLRVRRSARVTPRQFRVSPESAALAFVIQPSAGQSATKREIPPAAQNVSPACGNSRNEWRRLKTGRLRLNLELEIQIPD